MTLAGLQRGTLETAKDTGERTEHELAESTSSVAETGAELAAAVVSRIERPGLGPCAQNGTGEAALVATASAVPTSVPTSTLLVTGAALPVGPEHPLHRALGPTPWRRALRLTCVKR